MLRGRPGPGTARLPGELKEDGLSPVFWPHYHRRPESHNILTPTKLIIFASDLPPGSWSIPDATFLIKIGHSERTSG